MSCNCVSNENAMSYGEFLPYVLPYVSGCPDEIAEFHIKQAAIELAKFSGVLEYKQDINLWKNINTYIIDTPEGYDFARVVSIEYDGSRILNPFLNGVSCICGGCSFVVSAPDCITISPSPYKDKPSGLSVTTCVYPSQSSLYIDRDFGERYYETIAAGALERLFKLPKTEWQSLTLARDFGASFRAGKVQAKVDRMQNFTEGVIKMRTPRIL